MPTQENDNNVNFCSVLNLSHDYTCYLWYPARGTSFDFMQAVEPALVPTLSAKRLTVSSRVYT